MNKESLIIAVYLICIYVNAEARTFLEYANNPVVDTLLTHRPNTEKTKGVVSHEK